MASLYYPFATLFVIVCIFMLLLILIQKGRGGGLSSAFGGAGGNTAFGSKTGDVLTWATSVAFGVFLLLAVLMHYSANAKNARDTGTTAIAPGSSAPQPPISAPTSDTPVPADVSGSGPGNDLPRGEVPDMGDGPLPSKPLPPEPTDIPTPDDRPAAGNATDSTITPPVEAPASEAGNP